MPLLFFLLQNLGYNSGFFSLWARGKLERADFGPAEINAKKHEYIIISLNCF
jgi:hypothetical protein